MTQIALLFLSNTAPHTRTNNNSEHYMGTCGRTVDCRSWQAGAYRTQQDHRRVGHNPLPSATDNERSGAPCSCGKSGCVETFLSGVGLARDYHRRSGKHLRAQEIVLAASSGDECAQESMAVYQDRLARSLAVVINLLDPDVIVLGGGLSNMMQLYTGLSALVGLYTFSDGIDTPIARAAHRDSSGVRGAAWLWSNP